MSTFKNIQGKNIRSYANNAPNATAGEMWYNRAEQKLKGVVALSAWTSSSSMLQAREKSSGFGTQAAAAVAGGNIPPQTNATEEYNGSGWSTGGNLNTAKQSSGGAGTQTAGLAYGGYNGSSPYLADSEEYNGTAWSEGNNLNTARYITGSGSQTAALGMGGATSTGGTSACEEYDGTNWTAGGSLNTARNYIAGFGIQTAAVAATGGPAGKADVEEYDGSSWTTVNSVSNAREIAMSSGVQTDGIVYGGRVDPGSVSMNKTEGYDGTSWSNFPTMGTARFGSGANQSSGTASAAIAAGGNTNPPNTRVSITEEYNKSANVITAAAWSSGGNLPTANGTTSGGGPQTAAVQATGADDTDAAAEYNGSAWTATPNINTGRYGVGSSSRGSQTAMIIFAGSPGSPGSVNTTVTELWNGSSWANTGHAFAPPNGKRNLVGGGTSTAAVSIGGYSHAPDATNGYPLSTYLYDGSAWTTASPYNTTAGTGIERIAGGGPSTAALKIGGEVYSAPASPNYPVSNSTEEWNGSGWTTGGNFGGGSIRFGSMSGDSGNAITAYGNTGAPATPGAAFLYDGSSWATAPSTGTARQAMGSGGTAAAGLIFGGSDNGGTGLTATEEFTGETTAINIVDITTS